MILESMQGRAEAFELLSDVIAPTIDRWLLDNGEDMTSLNQVECPPELVGEPNGCFYNAGRIATFNSGYTYCEGLALSPDQVKRGWAFHIHHGWLIDSDGNIVDPTWEPGGEYYGFRFQAGLHHDLLGEHKFWDVLYYFANNYTKVDGEWVKG